MEESIASLFIDGYAEIIRLMPDGKLRIVPVELPLPNGTFIIPATGSTHVYRW